MPIKPSTNHGFPAKIRLPRQRSVVHVLLQAGLQCDEFVEVIIPARSIGMRDGRKRPSRCESPAGLGANFMCPECGSNCVAIERYDDGVCPETGYRDAGERFTCRHCGATGDASDLEMNDAA